MSPSSNHSTLLALGLILTVTLVAAAAWGISLLSDVDALVLNATSTPTKTPDIHAAISTTKNNLSPVLPPLPTFTPVLIPTAIARQTPVAIAPSSAIQKKDTQLSEKTRRIALAYRLNPSGDFIIVDQDAQQMIIVEEGEPKRTLSVTTGDPEQGWETPAWFGVVGDYWGTFQGAGGVRADDGWWLFQRGGNFLIHGLPYTLDESGHKHYAGSDDLGAAPASHGCIRLDPADAHWLTQWNPKGKPIIILPLTNKAKNES